MIITIENCQDSFIYCKIWTQNLGVKTSKKLKERVKNQKIQCLKIIWNKTKQNKIKTYDYIREKKIDNSYQQKHNKTIIKKP